LDSGDLATAAVAGERLGDYGLRGPRLTVSTAPTGGQDMTSKDKNTKKSMEKKPAQKTLKEKRQARKAKK
jgi:hypothetical protein